MAIDIRTDMMIQRKISNLKLKRSPYPKKSQRLRKKRMVALKVMIISYLTTTRMIKGIRGNIRGRSIGH
jgi:hypothetical protein